jgi:3-oxoacyl-[acyl-carrier-protein] synthase I
VSAKLVAGPVAVTGLGMVSSIGPDVANSCAAARAGITRASPLTVLNFAGEPLWGRESVIGHAVATAEGFTGLGKLVTLGAAALQDLVRSASIPGRLEPERTGLYINLSNKYFEEAQSQKLSNGMTPSDAWRDQTRTLISRLVQLCKVHVAPLNQALFFGGHAGFVRAVMQAIQQIRLGKLDHCIVGGIDSYLEAESLIATAGLGVLKTTVNPSGFVPGEAAAFLLLERCESTISDGPKRLATIDGVSLAEDGCDRLSERPSQGFALFQAIRTCVSSLSGEMREIGHCIGDLNGDVSRAVEWGYAVVRITQHFGTINLPLWCPAESFGEVGAAAGAVSCCIGIRAFERGYLDTDNVLVWLSSEDGAKGAFRLRRCRHRTN